MLDALRFWLDRGVDGFRVDVLWLLIKDEQFRTTRPIRRGSRTKRASIAICNAIQPTSRRFMRWSVKCGPY
jgi:glycosidase